MTSSNTPTEAPERTFAARSAEVVSESSSSLRPQFAMSDTAGNARLVPVITLVLWLGCSIVSVLGLTMPYNRPLSAKAPPEPMQVKLLNVELTSEPLPDLAPPVPNSPATPPPAAAIAQPQLPQTLAVALPSPAIAFAVPVEGVSQVVEAARASYNTSVAIKDAAPAVVPVQTLTYGQGAGRQPAPEYPWRAQSEGQEGVVNVRFTVAENGRVLSAEAVNPSPWPLLNDSAVRTVRNRWRFNAGATRAYEVAIRFVLPKERS